MKEQVVINAEPKVVESMKTLTIFSYFNYREYLQDYYAAKKTEDSSFSYRSFLKKSGLKSLGLYQRIVKGEVNLSEKSYPKFCIGLELNQKESNYFKLLVEYTDTQSFSVKQNLFEEMLSYHSAQEVKMADKRKEFYSHWYTTAIHQSLSVLNFSEDISVLYHFLSPTVSKDEIKRSLAILKSLDMIELDQDKYWRAKESILTGSGEEVAQNAIHLFQGSMMDLAKLSLENVPKEERNILTSTFSISDKGTQNLNILINQFHKNLMKLVQADSKENQILQLNLQLFPITKKL